MCGIAGIISASGEGQRVVERLTRAIAHCGPDDCGLRVDPEAGVGLGHRRLAIVDLTSAGHQPMHSADGRFVITFNGEVFYHRDLRAELESRGAVPDGGWRGHSDTEVCA